MQYIAEKISARFTNEVSFCINFSMADQLNMIVLYFGGHLDLKFGGHLDLKIQDVGYPQIRTP